MHSIQTNFGSFLSAVNSIHCDQIIHLKLTTVLAP